MGVLDKSDEEQYLERVGWILSDVLGIRVDLNQSKIGRYYAMAFAHFSPEAPERAILLAFSARANFPVEDIVKAVSEKLELQHYATRRKGPWVVIVWENTFGGGESLLKEIEARVFS